MTNWLADPAVCAIKAIKGGCHIMGARNEVMTRATRAVRTEEGDSTYWRWGHLYARRTLRSERLGGGVEIRAGGSDTPSFVAETAAMTPANANVLSDLLRAAVVDAGGQDCAGKSILELLWDELDSIMERLMTRTGADDLRDPGRAEGIAYAIAVMQNPYRVSVDNVRDQAMARWEAAQAADPEPAKKTTLERRRAARQARRRVS